MPREKKTPQNGDDKTKHIKTAIATMLLPDYDKNDPVAVRNRIMIYFKLCADNNTSPSIQGLCNALYITPMTLYRWKNGINRTELQEIVVRAYDALEQMAQEILTDATGNKAGLIFLTKNVFGYKDEQNIVVESTDRLELTSEEELRKLANALPPADDEVTMLVTDAEE